MPLRDAVLRNVLRNSVNYKLSSRSRDLKIGVVLLSVIARNEGGELR